jgi:predicted RND superfamily exporter protein
MNRRENTADFAPPRSHLLSALSLIVDRPWWVLLVIAAMTVGFGWALPRLHIATAVQDLIIEDIRENAHYHAFKQVFESDELIRIVIKNENIFDPEIFREIADLSSKAAQIKGVRRVISLADVKQTIDPSEKLTLKEFSSLIAPIKLFDRYLVSTDHRSTIVTLILENNAPSDQVIDATHALIRSAPVGRQIYQTGMPLVSRALADYTLSDLKRLPPLTLAIIAVILFALFRNIACLVLSLSAVLTAQVWTFGLMAWLGVPISMLTMIVPVFIIAVGTAYCLYMCSEYMSATQSAPSPKEAVYRTFNKLTFPTILAMITTLVGLGSLTINRISAIREFAFFAGFGILSLTVILLTAFPAALTLFPLPPAKSVRTGPLDRLLKKFIENIVQLNLRHQRVVLAALAILSVFCLIGIARIKVETNPVEYFKEYTPVSRNFHDIYQDLSGSFPLNIVVAGNTESYFEDIANLKELDRLTTYLETLPGVDKVITFGEYLKLVNYTLNQFDAQFYVLPEEEFELRLLINNFDVVLGNDTLSRFMTSDFSRTNVMLLTHLSSSRVFLETRDKILTEVRNAFSPDWQCDVTGLGIAISASSDQIVSGQVKSLILTFGLIFAMMALLFFSSKVGFIALLPTVFPIVLNFGFMGWFNIPLSFATSMIAGIAIGLSVDDTIHYLFRYNTEFKKDLDKDRALKDTLLSVGRPIVTTSLTISCGFAILMISHFKPTGLFGLLMVVTMISALVSALILLPGLMLKVELITAWDLLKWIPALGGIPPGIAHELKQPLNTIKVGSEFLKQTVGQKQPLNTEQLSRVVTQISSQVDRASAIINRLVELGRKPGTETALININHPLQDTLAMIENELRLDDIQLTVALAESLPLIRANDQRLAQVFFNLLTNAKEALAEKPQPSSSALEKTITVHTANEKNSVTVKISDNGIGIPPHLKDRIFEPFFSTKSEGGGKGLGLAICNQIIISYRGRISVESQEGIGTTVILTLPSTG